MPDAPAPEPALPQRPAGEEPREFRRDVNGVTIAGVEWAGDGDPIFLAHATGFHARVWDEVVRRLPGRRVVAVDLRGHGRSSKPKPPYDWHEFAVDVAAVIDDLDLRRIIGVGHSMGGHTIVDAALQRSERFAALVLVDPTIFSPDRPGPPVGTFDFVLRRRNEWGLPEEMVERFAGRRPFDVWAPRALRDYARYGLLPAPSGDGYVLACPPEVESAVYEGRDASPEHDVLSRVKQLTLPVRVLRVRHAAPDEKPAPFTTSPTMPALASLFPNGTDVALPHLSHFIPMQAPDLVARHILDIAASVEGVS